MKIVVVVLAPYSVGLPSGQHLAPGEIAHVEKDEYIESCVAAGKLAEVNLPDKSVSAIKPKTESESSSSKGPTNA